MLLIIVVFGKLLNENSLDFNKNISLLKAGLPVLEWFCFVPSDICSMACLLNFIYKKGYGANHTLLRRTRETSSVKLSFQCGFVSQKTLVSKCESAIFISLLTYYYTHFFEKIYR